MVVAVPKNVSRKRVPWNDSLLGELLAGNNPVNAFDPDGRVVLAVYAMRAAVTVPSAFYNMYLTQDKMAENGASYLAMITGGTVAYTATMGLGLLAPEGVFKRMVLGGSTAGLVSFTAELFDSQEGVDWKMVAGNTRNGAGIAGITSLVAMGFAPYLSELGVGIVTETVGIATTVYVVNNPVEQQEPAYENTCSEFE